LLQSISTGAATKFLTLTLLNDLEIDFPEIATQKRIVGLLSAYDEMTENNKRRIEILEQTAQVLYKEWFLNFRFPGCETVKLVPSPAGDIPQGWENIRLDTHFETVLGGTPSRRRAEFWEGGTIPWINSGKINELRVLEASEFITPAGLKMSSTKLMPKRTTVIAITGATLGQVSLTELEVCANQSVVGIYDISQVGSEYLYLTFKTIIQAVIQLASGGAQQHINKDIVNATHIVAAPSRSFGRIQTLGTSSV